LVFTAVLLSLVPWPIYVDVWTWTFIWRTPALSFTALPASAIPIPIGAMAFAVFCVINTLQIRGLAIRTEGVGLSPLLRWMTVAIVVLLFTLNTLYGGSMPKFIQLYVVLLSVFVLRLPVGEADIRYLTGWVFTSFLIMMSLHIVSVFSSEDYGVNEVYAYGTFLNGSVHGSLVSYPAVVFLYGVVLLIKSVNARRQVATVVVGLIPVLFALFADRRETAVQILVLGVALISAIGLLILTRRNDRLLVRCLKMAALALPPIVYFVSMGWVTSFTRIFIAEGDPRLEIWALAAPRDLIDFLVGNLRASNTAHSFGFSLLESFGVLGLVPMLLLTFGVIRFVTRKRPAPASGPVGRRRRTVATRQLILLAFSISLVSSNVFNTNITQPYYVVNLITLFMLLRTPDTGLVPPPRTAS